MTPTSVAGLTTATATVTLSGPAPAGGAAVFVTHDSLALDQNLLGIDVIVPAGATSASFTVGTYKVSVPMAASIIASYGGITQSAVLTVNPIGHGARVVHREPQPGQRDRRRLLDRNRDPDRPGPGRRDGGHARQQQHGRRDSPGQRDRGRRRDQRQLHGDHESGDRIHGRRDLGDRGSRDPVGHLDRESGRGGRNRVRRQPESLERDWRQFLDRDRHPDLPCPFGRAGRHACQQQHGRATVPATVTVPAGATSANFTVTTKTVTATTSVVISATGGGVTRSATLTVNRAATADTVNITKVEYTASKSSLLVEATSTSSSATLQVFVTATNQLIGTLTNNGGGKYTAQFSWPTNPQNITVKSSLGGSSSKAVTLK